ncbi:hypothetical protein P43SY_001098 [Pythium insidiosum]|uniref:Myb-like DNA-binding protein n=1 Tax=Pythium insidiosum TaxID=114742 RepID=A0AAD5MGN7_PYTIN|nr:hypothetical protein P43SY_001098 [Pythium insidiosum]
MATATPVQIKMERGVWSKEEHDRFLEALQRFPNGPWKAVAEHVGSRSVRQVQTHAQKYHEKVARRLRGLRKDRKRIQRPEHRIDDEMLEICQVLKRDRVPLSPRSESGESSQPPSPQLRPASLPAAIRATSALARVSVSSTAAVDEIMAVKEESDSYFISEPDHEPLGHRSDVPSFDECLDFLIEVLSSTEFSSHRVEGLHQLSEEEADCPILEQSQVGITLGNSSGSMTLQRGVWSKEEHDRFLEALQRFPHGPWKAVAEHVGSRSVRQVQTHAQKYHEKVARRLRGLRKDRKQVQQPEHRIDDEMLEICEVLKRDHGTLNSSKEPK